MAGVIEALQAGQSIRRAADVLGLDRNKVARLRQRAIAEGRLTVSPSRDMTAGSRAVHPRAHDQAAEAAHSRKRRPHLRAARRGATLRQVARQLGCDYSAILHWVREDQEAGGAFSHQYARARGAGTSAWPTSWSRSATATARSDGRPDNALVQQARLRVDTRKWMLSKMLPKRYGDRITQEIVGDGRGALITRIELVPVAPRPRPEELSAGGDEAGEVRLFPPRLGDRRDKEAV